MDFFTDCEVAPIFLAQSDTTAGFLCADFVKLNAIKGRLKSQNTLLTLDSFCKLKNLVRIPENIKIECAGAQKILLFIVANTPY